MRSCVPNISSNVGNHNHPERAKTSNKFETRSNICLFCTFIVDTVSTVWSSLNQAPPTFGRAGCVRRVKKGTTVSNDNQAGRERGGTRRRKNLSEKQLAIL